MKHIIAVLLLAFSSTMTGQVISGNVYWPDGSLVDQPLTLHVQFNGCWSFDHELDNGSFSLHVSDPLGVCDSVSFIISGEANARDGVSTLDMIKIVKHLLGIEPITGALSAYAADANESESISALDLVEIRKLILGQYSTWPKKSVLTFFHKTTTSPPLIGTILKRTVTIPVNQSAVIDFWAVKTGDIK